MDIQATLKKHAAWLRGHKEGVRANLQSADLQSADLQSAYLQSANLQSADLRGADLQGANLQSAYLQGANLRGANLQGADLQGANLRGAYLRTGEITETIRKIVATAVRSDGYYFFCMTIEEGPARVIAGCRDFSIAEYKKHVAREYLGTAKATETLDILAFFTARLKHDRRTK